METQIRETLEGIATESRAKLGRLAKGLVYAPSEQKEDILAGLEFHRWMNQACRECLEEDEEVS
jgi:hypothetical protein